METESHDGAVGGEEIDVSNYYLFPFLAAGLALFVYGKLLTP